MTARQMGPLHQRERDVLDVLVTMHVEAGLDRTFTHAQIAENAGGPCPGSLAALAMNGYVEQRAAGQQITYRVAERGFMLFAGVEGEL